MIAYLGNNIITQVYNANNTISFIPNVSGSEQLLEIDYLILGAGGEAFSGGGGAGQYVAGNASLLDGIYNVTAGKITTGTANSTQISGSYSSFNGIVSKGGGNGGYFNANISLARGWNGASGGGGSRRENALAGSGTNGFNGATGGTGVLLNRAGGGGGAASGGTNNFGTAGGLGLQWLDGSYYCGGGGAENCGGGGLGCSPAGGGGGNFGEGPSGPGMVKIRYAGVPKATGGTITQSGGYTYHTYTGTSTDIVSTFVYYSL